ncbi:hypothetical protein [Ekhidna sp.]|uniref:hypothetical protein n=1 Tax=Ekhidna sp. TaxID=2608089 RepID=UPI0032979E50
MRKNRSKSGSVFTRFTFLLAGDNQLLHDTPKALIPTRGIEEVDQETRFGSQ